MNNLEYLGDVIKTDVLVIGGGFAGLWAANRAKEKVGDVLIIEKGPAMGFAGQAFFSGGGIEAVPPGANPEDHVRDALYLGDGLYEQDLVERIFRQSWARIEEFQDLGVQFIENEDGGLWSVPQRGLNHLFCYLVEPFMRGGQDMMRALSKKTHELGVRYMNRIFITDLLRDGDAVVGAVGFDTGKGLFCIIQAGAVIIASGQCCLKGHYEDMAMSCGEGIEMGLRAGAELKNMEFNTCWVIPKHFRWEGIAYLLPLGAQFVDAQGNTFIDQYSPVLKSNIDYNFLVRFMAMEAEKGNGPFYLDCSRMTPENKKRMEPDAGWSELQYKKLLKAGIRPFEEKQEWTASAHWLSGGLHSDLEMQTNVPGLFVAGKSRATDPGIYFGGWSLCQCAATGVWAGENAASFALSNKGRIDAEEVKAFKKSLYAPLGQSGPGPDQVLLEVQKAVFPYPVLVLKNESRLKEALDTVETINHDMAPRMSAKDARELMRLRETTSISRLIEVFLKASLMRNETRASHYREDFPERHDQDWLKWIFVTQKEGDLDLRVEPLPLDKYKFKVDRFYSDNFQSGR
ncbi:MAG: FAD-binding protein [Deltaproteobacteria bacterium]|nr:FAD-binding protein [Deltaproteobacteria bacterium]